MAIVDRAPFALEQGDIILVPWPDRLYRRAIVLEAPEQLTIKGNDKVWRIRLRLLDSDDVQPDEYTIYRGPVEMMLALTEHEQHTEGVRGHRERPPATTPGQGTKGKGTLEE